MLFHDAGRGLLQLHRPKRTSNSIINLIRNGARKLSGMRAIVNMMHDYEGKVTPARGGNLLDLSISWEKIKINQHKEMLSQDYLNCRLVILFKFLYYAETTMLVKRQYVLKRNTKLYYATFQTRILRSTWSNVPNSQCQAVPICAGARFLLLGLQE